MQALECGGCGAHEFREENGYLVCAYCERKHSIPKEETQAQSPASDINLEEDVANLLKKCREDPASAKKYAVRILEIDPYNTEAKNILNPPKKQKSGGCYVATAVYGSYDCPEVWTLRRYRDGTLAKTWRGRAFIRLYYAVSPTIVRLFGKTAWFQSFWRRRLDRMVAGLRAKGLSDTPYADRDW